MSKTEMQIEELERPVETLAEEAAAEVRGGLTLQASASTGDQTDRGKTEQTRQITVIQDL